MYDEIVKQINLSADEIELLSGLLLDYLEKTISVREEITVQELFEKINGESITVSAIK